MIEEKINTAEKIIAKGGRLDKAVILKYLKRGDNNKYYKIYLCLCDCGKEFEASLNHINKIISLKRIFQCQECAKKKQKQIASFYGKHNIKENSKIDCVEKTKLSKLGRIKSQKNNSSTDYAGIRYRKNGYEINISINGKHIYLGRRKTLAEAIKLRLDAIKKYHKPLIDKYDFQRKNKKIEMEYIGKNDSK